MCALHCAVHTQFCAVCTVSWNVLGLPSLYGAKLHLIALVGIYVWLLSALVCTLRPLVKYCALLQCCKYNVVLCSIVQHYIVFCSNKNIVQCCSVICSVVQFCVVMYTIVLWCAVLFSVLKCCALICSVLQWYATLVWCVVGFHLKVHCICTFIYYAPSILIELNSTQSKCNFLRARRYCSVQRAVQFAECNSVCS